MQLPLVHASLSNGIEVELLGAVAFHPHAEVLLREVVLLDLLVREGRAFEERLRRFPDGFERLDGHAQAAADVRHRRHFV